MKKFNDFVKNKNYTKLAIFDFDGTIAFVPERPGPSDPKHNWNGKDWWGSHDSLTPPHYNGEVNDVVIDAFKKAKADPSTRAVLLTGRRGLVADPVRNILRDNGLIGKRIIPDSNKKLSHTPFSDENHPEAHEEYFNGDHSTEEDYPKTHKGKPEGGTLIFKHYILTKKLFNQNVEEIDIWDDRADHMPSWIKIGVELQKNYPNLQRYTIHRVFPNEGGHIQTIPVKKDSQW